MHTTLYLMASEDLQASEKSWGYCCEKTSGAGTDNLLYIDQLIQIRDTSWYEDTQHSMYVYL